jgi:hypothetical protein
MNRVAICRRSALITARARELIHEVRVARQELASGKNRRPGSMKQVLT